MKFIQNCNQQENDNAFIDNKCEIAFTHFFKDNINLYLKFGLHFIDDPDIVKDIVQESFITIWEHFDTFKGDEVHLKAFLYTSVRNKAINYLRDRKVVEKHRAKLLLLQDDVEFTNLAVEEEICDFLNKKIERLSPMQRDVLQLHMQGYDNQKIADILKISINTVNTHKQRARFILKSYIDHFLFVFINFI